MMNSFENVYDDVIYFEIYGKPCRLREYDEAIEKNKVYLGDCYPLFKEFPYTIRSFSAILIEKIKKYGNYIPDGTHSLSRRRRSSFWHGLPAPRDAPRA